MLEIKPGELKGAPITESLAQEPGTDFADFVGDQLADAEVELYTSEIEDLKPTSFMHSMGNEIADKLGMPPGSVDMNPASQMLSNISEYLFDLGARDSKSCINMFCKLLSLVGTKSTEPISLLQAVDKFIRSQRELRAIEQTNKIHGRKFQDLA